MTAEPQAVQASSHWEAQTPVFYGWIVVAVSLVISFFGAGMFWGGSVFVIPMQEDLGWSRSAIYLAFAVRGWMSIVLSPILGPYGDRGRGAMVLAVSTGTLSSIATMLISTVTEEWQFVLLFGVVGGIGIVGQMLPTYALVPKWFIRKRGSAMGWASMGSPLAALALAPALAILIDVWGWRASWLALGVASLLCTVLPSLLLRRQPEDVGLAPDGDAPRSSVSAGHGPPPLEAVSATVGDVVKQHLFWLLVFGVSMGSLSNNGLPGSLVPMFSDRGFSREMAVAGFSLYGLFSMLGRFFWAYVVGRVHVRWTVVAMAIGGVLVSPTWFVLPGDWALVYAALNGFVIGGYVSLSPMVWPVYFGRHHVGAISGLARTFITVVASGGTILMAQLYDRLGNYDLALWLITASWVLCAGTVLVAPPKAARPARVG